MIMCKNMIYNLIIKRLAFSLNVQCVCRHSLHNFVRKQLLGTLVKLYKHKIPNLLLCCSRWGIGVWFIVITAREASENQLSVVGRK